MLGLNKQGMIVKVEAPVNKDGVIATNVLSISAHSALARALTKKIHAVTPVVKGILLRAEKDETGNNIKVYGEVFMTKGSNNPNAIALMQASGDFETTEQPVVQIQHWDKDAKELVKDYSVKCNEKVNGRTHIFTNTHVVVEYGQLEADLRKIMKYASDKKIADMKNEFVHKIADFGLVQTAEGIRIATANDTNGRLSVLNWSPSNMRNESQLLSPLSENEAFESLDKTSGGVLSEALKGKVSIGDLIKLSARLGILGAPAVLLGQEANSDFGCVIVLDEIEGTEDYDAETRAMLAANGIVIDRNTYDGGIVHGVEKIQAWFASLGRKMSIEKALLFALQTRSNKYFTKVFGEAKTQNNMQFRLQKLIDIYGIDKVLFVEAGADVSALNKEDYKVVVVGNRNNLGTIMDYNGGKLLKNISLQTIVDGNIDTYLLDIAKCSDTETSGQLLNKLLVADSEGTRDALLECLANDYNNRLDEMRTGDVDAHSSTLAQFIFRYVEEGNTNQAAIEAIIKEELSRQKSMVYNAKINIKAWFQRALFDDSHFLTAGKVMLLNKNETTGRLECYSRDIEVKFEKEITAIEADETLSREEKDAATDRLLTGAAVKFPSPSSDEFAVLTYVTAARLERRIEALELAGVLNSTESTILKDEFTNTSYGVTKLGADNTLKHKLAGMDTDYDGIAIVFERKLVDILIAKYPTTDGVACVIAG